MTGSSTNIALLLDPSSIFLSPFPFPCPHFLLVSELFNKITIAGKAKNVVQYAIGSKGIKVSGAPKTGIGIARKFRMPITRRILKTWLLVRG